MRKATNPEQYIADVTNPLSFSRRQILTIIAKGNPDGSYVDKFQILERCTFTDKLNNVWFGIRYLKAQKRLEIAGRRKDPGRSQPYTLYRITPLGLHLLYGDGENNSATQKPPSL